MSLIHFNEIFVRCFYIFISFSFVFFFFFLQKSNLLFILINQISPDYDLQTNTFFEAFFVQIEICLFCSFSFFIPFLIFQFWQFFVPALYTHERNAITQFCLFISLLTFFWFLFGTFYLPSFICFFSKFLIFSESTPYLIQINLTDFAKTYTFFQICIFFYFLSLLTSFWFSLFTFFNLVSFRFWIALAFICFSALLSPGDFLSQLCLTAFFQFHFEIFIFSYFVANHRVQLIQAKKEIHPLQPALPL